MSEEVSLEEARPEPQSNLSRIRTALAAFPPEHRNKLLTAVIGLVFHSGILVTSLSVQGEQYPESDEYPKWFGLLTNWQLIMNFVGEIYDISNIYARKPLNDAAANMRASVSSATAVLYWATYQDNYDFAATRHVYNHGAPAIINLIEAVFKEMPCQGNLRALKYTLSFALSYLGVNGILGAAGAPPFYKILRWREDPATATIWSMIGVTGFAVFTKITEWEVSPRKTLTSWKNTVVGFFSRSQGEREQLLPEAKTEGRCGWFFNCLKAAPPAPAPEAIRSDEEVSLP